MAKTKSKSVHDRVVSVWRANLTQLCEKRASAEAIAIIEANVADGEVLEKAIEEVTKALCPWPALKISDWFWETTSGRKIAWAQWKLYGSDAISPSQAARLLWGKNTNTNLKRIQNFIRQGRLHSYFNPTIIGEKTKKTGRIYRSTYVRRSEVLHLIETGQDQIDQTKQRRKPK